MNHFVFKNKNIKHPQHAAYQLQKIASLPKNITKKHIHTLRQTTPQTVFFNPNLHWEPLTTYRKWYKNEVELRKINCEAPKLVLFHFHQRLPWAILYISTDKTCQINMSPLVACHMVALVAFPSHPLVAWVEVEVEQNLLPSVVQAKPEGAIEHTYSARLKKLAQLQKDAKMESNQRWIRRKYYYCIREDSQIFTCCLITSFSSLSLAFASFAASILYLINSSTLPVYSRINWKTQNPTWTNYLQKNRRKICNISTFIHESLNVCWKTNHLDKPETQKWLYPYLNL